MKWILVIFMSYLSYSQQEFNFNEYNKKCGDLFRYIELNTEFKPVEEPEFLNS